MWVGGEMGGGCSGEGGGGRRSRNTAGWREVGGGGGDGRRMQRDVRGELGEETGVRPYGRRHRSEVIHVHVGRGGNLPSLLLHFLSVTKGRYHPSSLFLTTPPPPPPHRTHSCLFVIRWRRGGVGGVDLTASTVGTVVAPTG